MELYCWTACDYCQRCTAKLVKDHYHLISSLLPLQCVFLTFSRLCGTSIIKATQHTASEFSLCYLLSSGTHLIFSNRDWLSLLRDFHIPHPLVDQKDCAYMLLAWLGGSPLPCCMVSSWNYWTQLMRILGPKSGFLCPGSGPPSVLWAQSCGFPLTVLYCISFSYCGVMFPHSSLILSTGLSPPSAFFLSFLHSHCWLLNKKPVV